MDEWEWVTAARNRQTVLLTSGQPVTLLSWGTRKGRNRARVEHPNGRQRTVHKNEIASMGE
jgi:endonuclease YncB( thermonuclease family)